MKTYRANTGTYWMMWIKFPERQVQVEFKGGRTSPSYIPPRFSTNSVKIQDALERHPWFNVKFVLEEPRRTQKINPIQPKTGIVTHTPPPNVVQGATPTTSILQGAVVNEEPPIVKAPQPVPETQTAVYVPEPEPEDTSGIQVIEDVRNGQQAKNWLHQNVPGVPLRKLINNTVIREVARENKIQFPNWV